MPPKQPRTALLKGTSVPEAEHQRLFGVNLREARLAEGMLQAEVAAIAGVNRPAKVSDIENGKINITLRTMSLLAKAVNRNLTVLLEDPTKK